MNRAYTPRRAFTSCYIPGASNGGTRLAEVTAASRAARVPNYAVGDVVEWDLGMGRQTGRVEQMFPGYTVIRQGGPNGTLVRLAPDRPRRVGA